MKLSFIIFKKIFNNVHFRNYRNLNFDKIKCNFKMLENINILLSIFFCMREKSGRSAL